MTFNFIYEPDFERIIPSIIIDSRASIPEIKNQNGVVIKAYIDLQLALLDDKSICYKIETELGVLAGIFAIKVNSADKSAILIMQILRPAFQQFTKNISAQTSNFISNGEYKKDFLF